MIGRGAFSGDSGLEKGVGGNGAYCGYCAVVRATLLSCC